MDKKGSRSVQSSSKGLSTESKKNQDGVGGKLWPRGGRRREPNGGTYATKNETSRKPNPQKTKSFDKRPRPRGNYHSGILAGKEVPGLSEGDAELGSVFVQGSKKQSLNHLLNFHYLPRESQWHSGRSVGTKLGYRWLTTIKHKYNKEQFLQANCQFIVKASGNYKQYMNSPDTLVDWDLVEQVNVQVSDNPSCPICLYPPVAAKMTRCGHVYCWSCILHYLALSDKTLRKCPICFESIHKQDLKSVVSITHPSLTVNDLITFKLMKRLRGSLIAYPAEETIRENDQVIFNMSEKETANIYCKLLLADKNEVLAIIDRERCELQVAFAEDENCPERCFIQEALELLQARENTIFNQLDNKYEKLCSGVSGESSDKQHDRITNRERNESVGSEKLDNDDALVENTNITVEDLDISQSKVNNQQVKYFYFYQASDGQHIYLHAINARMLEHTYGSLEMAPKIITGKIVEKEGGSMTEELRNRLRYLQHLPVTCQFEVAEIQLREPIISKETLNLFHDQLEMRKKRRQKRARDEKRREKRISEEENRIMGKFPDAKICLASIDQFPEVGFEPLVPRAESESTPRSERSLSPAPEGSSSINTPSSSLSGSLSTENEYSGPSFAKMVSSAKKPIQPKWPELKSENKPASVRLINVTGAKTTPNITRIKKHSDSEPESDDYVPVPQFNRSFGDAIALALEKAAISKDDEGEQAQSGKKKKKNKQKVLFATGMTYSGK
ncbi:ring finger 10 family member [Holotrichia oblita]|uniref:Ring finger 10 family member n=1 Tax=Holotrichia oblita TaxID=644536 RepID=A0ACB9T2E3_HOLOL|nr:ring finger 10 family member [Holotrichia oblita]